MSLPSHTVWYVNAFSEVYQSWCPVETNDKARWKYENTLRLEHEYGASELLKQLLIYSTCFHVLCHFMHALDKHSECMPHYHSNTNGRLHSPHAELQIL